MIRMRKARAVRGMTLLEIMIVIAILGLLASVIVAAVMNNFERAKISTTRIQLDKVKQAVQMSSVSNDGEYPNKIEDLLNPADGGPALITKKHMKDPWNQPIVYRLQGDKQGEPFSLRSKGPDGAIDTNDDISAK